MPLLDNLTLELNIGSNNGNNDGNGNNIANKNSKTEPALGIVLPMGDKAADLPTMQATPSTPSIPVTPSAPNIPVSVPNVKVQRRGSRRLITRNPFLENIDLNLDLANNNGNNDGNGNKIANKGGDNSPGSPRAFDKPTGPAMPAVSNSQVAQNTPQLVTPDVRVTRRQSRELMRRGPILGNVGLHLNIGTGNGNNDGNGNQINNKTGKEANTKPASGGPIQTPSKDDGSVAPNVQTSPLSVPAEPVTVGAKGAPQPIPVEGTRPRNSRRRIPGEPGIHNFQGRRFARGRL
ncbi:hypothetical protein AA313_de0200208 [Arthrobotrys entomopaga]|nr:hypothetical protein AA313_de0200208 [Arthrobotrys entomopaga]